MKKHELLQHLEPFSDEIEIFVSDPRSGVTCMFQVQYLPPGKHSPGRLILRKEASP